MAAPNQVAQGRNKDFEHSIKLSRRDKDLKVPTKLSQGTPSPLKRGFSPRKRGLNGRPNQLPKGGRNFPSKGERDLPTPTKLHKDSLGKAPFCRRKMFPGELGWDYHLVLSPTRKVFFSLEEVVR